MKHYKSNIREAILNWNLNNPTLRKKTLKSVAEELGISSSALSQIDNVKSSNQFQKHCAVIFESRLKSKQIETFNLYLNLDIPIINRLNKICVILECQVYDLVKIVERPASLAKSWQSKPQTLNND